MLAIARLLPVIEAGKNVKLKLTKMKKLILIFLAAIAFSCGDGNNRSSESRDNETEDNYSREPMESDTTDMRTDTTTTPGMDRGIQRSDTASNSQNNNP